MAAITCTHAISLDVVTTYGSASDISAFNAAAGEYEGWENLVNSNPALSGLVAQVGGYPGMTPWFSSIDSNTTSTAGNGSYAKTGGSGYVGNGSIYSGFAGSFSLSSTVDSLSDVNTVIFQLDAGLSAAWNSYSPTLSYNGGSQALQADYRGLTDGSYSSGAPGGPVSSTTNLLYQWDLSEIGDAITSFDISYDVAAHTSQYALQLNSSEATLGSVIPEPGTYALLAGLAALGACAIRRRQK